MDSYPSSPDIVLSLGTGRAKNEPNSSTSSITSSNNERPRNWLRTIFKLIKNQIHVNLDSERTWQMYAKQQVSNSAADRKLFRINPDLGYDPPSLDDVSSISTLQTTTKGLMVNNPLVTEVACTLIASSFYFERTSRSLTQDSGAVSLPGTIKLRFTESEKVRAVGSFLQTRTKASTPPSLVIMSAGNAAVEYAIPCAQMMEQGTFECELASVRVLGRDARVTIALSLPGAVKERANSLFAISGFPRALMEADFRAK